VFPLGRRIAEGTILMSTFEELILIRIFCFAILENELILTLLLFHRWSTLFSITSVSCIFSRERNLKKRRRKLAERELVQIFNHDSHIQLLDWHKPSESDVAKNVRRSFE